MGTRRTSRALSRHMLGFTLIELMVAIAVSSIVAGLAVHVVRTQSAQARTQEVQRFLVDDLPKAMFDKARSSASSDRLNNATQLEDFGASLVTPWGQAWSITSNSKVNGKHTVSYPIGGTDAATRGQALAKFLAGDTAAGTARFTFIQAANYNNGTLRVTYRALL